MQPEISIIVPMFNEADNVAPLAEQVIAALRAETRPFELVLVDDASTDATWDRITAASRADARVRGLRHGRNAGQSAALWTGFRNSRAPIIVTLDGDLQNDPADFPRLLAELEKYDVACGMRTKRQDNALRRISSKIARKARAAMLGVDFRDTGCGLRAFKRPVLDPLFAFNGFHRFMPVLAHSAGARVIEIPVNHRPRVAGISKYGLWNRLGRGIVDLFAVRWFQKRLIPSIPITQTPSSTP
ncbi:MAG TPA: glycosyltransferase family 2 protein [Verrucomicrobiae bacterium]|nr:glycosyltransferase family 2 protein [Verrucomicrobiae bacterium]